MGEILKNPNRKSGDEKYTKDGHSFTALEFELRLGDQDAIPG